MDEKTRIVAQNVTEALENVRERNPLVHNITNFVVMNSTANGLLAVGASPIMAHAEEELEELIRISNALVLNIGTLDKKFINSMKNAAEIARNYGKTTVLDPVGAGATRLRTEVSLDLIDRGNISVLRGNYGELIALLGESGKTKGVDAAEFSEEGAKQLSVSISKNFGLVNVVSGPADYISDGNLIVKCSNGVELLTKVTGSGCLLTALIGAFSSVSDPLIGSVAAVSVLNIAAEKAFDEAKTPGTFQMKLFDNLYTISKQDILERIKIRVEEV